MVWTLKIYDLRSDTTNRYSDEVVFCRCPSSKQVLDRVTSKKDLAQLTEAMAYIREIENLGISTGGKNLAEHVSI